MVAKPPLQHEQSYKDAGIVNRKRQARQFRNLGNFVFLTLIGLFDRILYVSHFLYYLSCLYQGSKDPSPVVNAS